MPIPPTWMYKYLFFYVIGLSTTVGTFIMIMASDPPDLNEQNLNLYRFTFTAGIILAFLMMAGIFCEILWRFPGNGSHRRPSGASAKPPTDS